MRNAELTELCSEPRTSPSNSAFIILHSAFVSFPLPLIISPIHYPARPPLRRPLIAPLLLRRLRHDRRYGRRLPVLVQRHVGHVARVGVPLLAREHVFRDELHPHLHRRVAREVHT